jgi:large subunit ribosomal protein L13
MNRHKRTYTPNADEAAAQRGWWVVDATNVPLGRLASTIANKLRGKDKAIFTPHMDTGDFVVVVNADKIKLTGSKENQMRYYHHSGYAGGLREVTYRQVMDTRPELPLTKAVKGMLPKNSLGRKLIKKLKVYVGPDHPHTAQTPQPLSLG